MRIDELPRLTDDERDAIDGGYIAMEGVPAFEPPAPRRFPTIAKIIAAIAAAIALSGCALTPAGLYLRGAVEIHESMPAPPPREFFTYDANVTRNPYGQVAVGYDLDVSPNWKLSVELKHTSSMATSGDRGTNAAAFAVTWRPFASH